MTIIQLSPVQSRNCEQCPGYTSNVTFGRDLWRLRKQKGLKGPQIAVAALGEHSEKRKRRDLANYLSKIERDKVPNVGLPKLQLIAKGFGFPSLADFFAALEGRSRSWDLNPSSSDDKDSIEESADARSISQEAAEISTAIVSLGEAIGRAGDRLADRLEQITDPRRHKATRRQNPGRQRA